MHNNLIDGSVAVLLPGADLACFVNFLVAAILYGGEKLRSFTESDVASKAVSSRKKYAEERPDGTAESSSYNGCSIDLDEGLHRARRVSSGGRHRLRCPGAAHQEESRRSRLPG
jgi:hypothetical protein